GLDTLNPILTIDGKIKLKGKTHQLDSEPSVDALGPKTKNKHSKYFESLAKKADMP
ncbi:hypothetical protein HAX54_029784, partial [Datura stramonium]|nr:hypothetical protein [Datura stramonium]